LTTSLSKRRTLARLAGLLAAPASAASVTRSPSPEPPFASVVPGYVIRFPDDEGSHPDFRVEWWYLTGWLAAGRDTPLGFQITFFRVRPDRSTGNPSAFAPRHVLIAHAAISDAAHGRLQHDQRAARAAFDLAGASVGKTHVWIDDWALRQEGGRYRATISAPAFRLELELRALAQPLVHGLAGYSQKGPQPESASYYYSLPRLAVTGVIVRDGRAEKVRGMAWLDHEWSSSYMDERAVGWDWIGINLDDGGALMAFQMRDAADRAFWAGGTHRSGNAEPTVLAPGAVRFTPRRRWRSARTGATYPVSWTVRAGDLEIGIEPLMDDQEHDTRVTTGTIYWEGAVRAVRDGAPAGRGYLELTGYWRPLRL
jgi:predicted secreted hydrolase